jgi:hypothetical protein
LRSWYALYPARKDTAIHTENDTRIITDGVVELTIPTAFGPRITGFSVNGGENVFAELGEMGIDLPDGGKYHLRGGHRLWAAPEIPDVTYESDDDEVSAAESDDGLVVGKPGASVAGIGKTITVSLRDGVVTVVHTLTNQRPETVYLAPWAITQLRPGGTAIIPLPLAPTDAHGLHPNASIVIWPYTGVADNPFVIHNRLVLLDADRGSATKIGVALERGWIAYVRNGVVFVKRSVHEAGASYLDLGASGQCYSNPDFIELETLGPLTPLETGESTTHTETWEMHTVEPSAPPEQIPDILNLDGGTHL